MSKEENATFVQTRRRLARKGRDLRGGRQDFKIEDNLQFLNFATSNI